MVLISGCVQSTAESLPSPTPMTPVLVTPTKVTVFPTETAVPTERSLPLTPTPEQADDLDLAETALSLTLLETGFFEECDLASKIQTWQYTVSEQSLSPIFNDTVGYHLLAWSPDRSRFAYVETNPGIMEEWSPETYEPGLTQIWI